MRRVLLGLLLCGSALAVEADAVRKAIQDLSDSTFDRREAASLPFLLQALKDPSHNAARAWWAGHKNDPEFAPGK